MLRVKRRPIEELLPYPNNARTHSEAQVAQIAASIKEFGFLNPVLVDKDGGIIAGHGRVMGARLLEMKDVPTICIDHLTPAQQKAYIIADNKLALNAGWDEELLRLEFEALDEAGFDIDLIGFDDDYIEDLLKDADDDDLPDLGDGDKEPFRQITFTLHEDQVSILEDALHIARSRPEIDTGINDNRNGNAITHIVEQWLRVNAE